MITLKHTVVKKSAWFNCRRYIRYYSFLRNSTGRLFRKEFDAEKGIRNKVLAIDYSKLVPYLIKMVQIQQEEIEKLKEAMNKEGVSND